MTQGYFAMRIDGRGLIINKAENEKANGTMNSEHRISTDDLMQLLMKDRSLQSFMNSNEGEFGMQPFCEYITMLQKDKGEAAERIILRGHIEKSYGHQIFRGARKPSRDTCIQLAFGFEMDVEQAQRLLRAAGKSMLYPRVLRDAAIIYSLHNGISLSDTQIVLENLGLPIIGGASTNDGHR